MGTNGQWRAVGTGALHRACVEKSDELRVVTPTQVVDICTVEDWEPRAMRPGELRVGAQAGEMSILVTGIRDSNGSGSVDQGDDFVFMENQGYVFMDNWPTSTYARVPLELPSPSERYAIACADFTEYETDIAFSAEPGGSVFSWWETTVGAPLERQLFSDYYAGHSWHALESRQGPRASEDLVGLCTDPARPNECKVVLWEGQKAMPTPQVLLQTAPVTRIMPEPSQGGGYSAVDIRVWDAEGNAVLPLLQYMDPATSNWVDAAVTRVDGQTYSLSMSVAAMPTGTDHELTWNAAADLGDGFTGNVFLRAAAVDVTLWGDWSPVVPYALSISADSDGDGLPDDWEDRYGLSPSSTNGIHGASGDFDGDGVSNGDEFTADTNPADENSYLAITAVSNATEGIYVQWQGGTGAWQYVECIPYLGGTAQQWSAIYTNPPPTAVSEWIIDAGATNRTLFYRIKASR